MATDQSAPPTLIDKASFVHFAPLQAITTPPAARLVRFARVSSGDRVLDVACGTGVVAVTAARLGAQVRGLDFSAPLLAHARESAELAGVEAEFDEGDVEALPYPDASFDVVLSQFGHVFAPHPARAIAEMLRVLRPGGCIAFAAYPREHQIGQMMALLERYVSPPSSILSILDWGDPEVVRERLGGAVQELVFRRDDVLMPALSPAHYRAMLEATVGPVMHAVASLANDPERLAALRAEIDALTEPFLEDNYVHQPSLVTRAVRRADAPGPQRRDGQLATKPTS